MRVSLGSENFTSATEARLFGYIFIGITPWMDDINMVAPALAKNPNGVTMSSGCDEKKAKPR